MAFQAASVCLGVGLIPSVGACGGEERPPSRGDFENVLERFVEVRFSLLGSINQVRNLQVVSQSTKVITFPLDT